MEKLIINSEYATTLLSKEQFSYQEGQAVSFTLTQRPGVGLTLFAFDAGEGISPHAAPGDAIAYVLADQAQITIAGVVHEVSTGGAIIMPAGVCHACNRQR